MTMNKIAKMITMVMVVGTVASCSPAVEHKNVEEVRMEQPASPVKEYRVGDQLPNELVCMVNNAYMGKLQIPVKVMDRTYYGCCEMCKAKLNEDESARTSRDPFSGKMVNKSEAYIVLLSTQGEVAYFESEESYRDFIQK
jgi:YHS domain-containing protein